MFLYGVLNGVLGEIKGNRWDTEGSFERNEDLEEKTKDEDIERDGVATGVEPTISEVEVEGANQCATPSQTKLRERNGNQCSGRNGNQCSGHHLNYKITLIGYAT